MKSNEVKLKKIYMVFAILPVLLSNQNIFAQTASITWALSNTTQLASAGLGNVTGSAESISSGSGQFGMTVFDYNADGQRLWEGTAGWIAGSEESNRYIQFDALPASGNGFTVTNISFNYGSAGINSNIQSNAYYSTDGWITRTQLNSNPLSYPSSAMSSFTKIVSVTIANAAAFSIRIYPYSTVNSSPMSPTFAVHNNIVISGTTAAIPTKKNSILIVTNAAGKWGKSVQLTAHLQEIGSAGNTDLPYKMISFSRQADTVDNPIRYIGSGTTDANGIASISYTIQQDSAAQSLSVPQDSVTHTITASFAGDADYNAQSSTGKLTVVRHLTILSAKAGGGSGKVFFQDLFLTDNDNSSSGIPNQVLKFYIDKVLVNSGITNSSGAASISYTIPQDSVAHSITVSFAGDANYSPQNNIWASKKIPTIQMANTSGKWNKSVMLTAVCGQWASNANGTAGLANKVLLFYVDKIYVNSGTTNPSGVASVMYKIPQDSVTHSISAPQDSVAHSITASFAGDINYYLQSGTGKLISVRHLTGLSVASLSGTAGQSVKLEATLSDNDNNKSPIPNQVAKFDIVVIKDGQSIVISEGSGTTNASGVASLSYTMPGTQDSVSRSISVSFAGDANYSPQTGKGTLTFTLTGVENNPTSVPTVYDLSQNYPNPFNPTSTIRYDIPKTGFVNISVYNILGEKISVLVNEMKSPGHYEIIFDAKKLSSGIYIYSIRAGDFIQSKKMILMK